MPTTEDLQTDGQPSDRYSRQRRIVPHTTPCTIIGVGAVGRNVAYQLASLGVEDLQLVDFDDVEEHNIAGQGFLESEVGLSKVEAVHDTVLRINSDIRVDCLHDRWRPSQALHEVVFVCIDNITARGAIWRGIKERTKLLLDSRMLGEHINVLAFTDVEAYGETLFSQHEAIDGVCGNRSTLYASQIAAGIMVHQYVRWLREIPVDNDTYYDMLAGALIVK